MNEPERTKARKPASLTGQDETTDQADPSTLGYDATASPATPSFGDYEFITEIARGGMGVVYKARQKSLNRIVALKMIKSGEFANQEQVDRFYKEAEAAANLDHPGIVPVYEVGAVDGQHYFTMGFVEGESLADRIRKGPLPPREAAIYAKAIAEAVAYAHSKGVIHRDLKPGNVLITREGIGRLTDFGLAKRIEDDSELTSTGQILGTPNYMPPEQAEGKLAEIGPSADVYAIGATLYCILIGKPPFQASNVIETLHQVIELEPISLKSQNPGIPSDLETLCLKCLEKKPSNRYSSAHELGVELGRYLNGEAISARPIGRIEKIWRWSNRKPAQAIAVAAVLFLAVAGPWSAIRQSIANRQTAIARVDALLNASPAAASVFLDDIDRDRALVGPRLRELAQSDLTDSQRLRLSLALLPTDSKVLDYLKGRLSDCTYEELAVMLIRLKNNGADRIKTELWNVFRNEEFVTENNRFRAGLALAGLDSDSDKWSNSDYQFLVKRLLNENTLHQQAIRRSLKPIADELISPLEVVFKDPLGNETVKESAANAIVDFAGNHPELLTQLATKATPNQFSVLFPEVARAAELDSSILHQLQAITKLEPANDLNESQRVALGKRRAGAAISLVRMGQLNAALEVLRIKDDPESRTQFVHGCKSRGVSAIDLLDLLNRATYPFERYGVLLALGEFSPSDIPAEVRSTWIDHVKVLFANDPSSGVHGASGWLLRHWGFVEEVETIEHRAVPYSPDREWFTLRIDLSGNGVVTYFTFVVFPPGEYAIGSPTHEQARDPFDEEWQKVTLSRGFAILDREITQREFRSVTGFAGYENQLSWMSEPETSMSAVSWYMAVGFSRMLSTRTGIAESEQAYADPIQYQGERDASSLIYTNPPKNWPVRLDVSGFRLPTSAEWEIACRAGMNTTFYFGSDRILMSQCGWCQDNSQKRGHPPAKFHPNPRGLFDVLGNMWEWCHDWYAKRNIEDKLDPVGQSEGAWRELRGGGWGDTLGRCADRDKDLPPRSDADFGIRIVISIP